jgi:hypothetical protein
MEWLFLLVILAVVVFAILKAKAPAKIVSDNPEIKSNYSYKAVDSLFTPAERSFLGVLDQAVAGRARVFGKVRVLDVIVPDAGLSQSERTTALNKINRKHFDFILCRPGDLSVICVIELDDKSHQRKARQERDEFLLVACNTAGVPMIQVPAKAAYTVSNITELFAEFLPEIESATLNAKLTLAEGKSGPTKKCPKCSSDLVERSVKNGVHAGKRILACSIYPKCRFYQAVTQ